jgi:site-specific DNA-methyltransferase (adenine-specific)
MIDLRLGRWQDALADVTECDVVMCDPPYSDGTHENYLSGSGKQKIDGYSAFGITDRIELCEWVAEVCRWWAIFFGDYETNATYMREMDRLGWLSFRPVIWTKRGAAPRMSGDGPASQVEYISISRRRGKLPSEEPSKRSGSRPGWYITGLAPPSERFHGFVGQKPVALMSALIRDYTLPGDLIVDPFCGSGTTAIAAREMGRSCITSEMDPNTYKKAKQRIEKPWSPQLPGMADFDGDEEG